jgi:hypothetical protein
MKYAVEMGSDVMMFIIKIGSSIQKLIVGDSQTDRQTDRSHKPTFI